ncbi:tRNA(Ser) Um(44) 2'-O-methyltransferase [Fusarium falciforme]
MEIRRKLPFDPEELPPGSPPALRADGDGGGGWVPVCRHACTFETRYFDDIMLNLVRNPNLNSKWLFRADVLYDDGDDSQPHNKNSVKDCPSIPDFQGLIRQRTIVRRLIPRNTLRDAPLDQTCSFYTSSPPVRRARTLQRVKAR